MRYWLGIALLISGFTGAQSGKAVQKLNGFLTGSHGFEMVVDIYQKQFESIDQMTGVFELIGAGQYLFESDQESVYIDGQTVKTWNKVNHQLIIDERIPGEFSFFNLLSGDFEGVLFERIHGEKDSLGILPYTVRDIGIQGEIHLNIYTGRPHAVSVDYGPDQRIDIKVKSVIGLKDTSRYQLFNPQVKDVIDLRE